MTSDPRHAPYCGEGTVASRFTFSDFSLRQGSQILHKPKFRRYAALGVTHYWIVDPDDRAIDCYRMRDGRFERIAGAAAGTPVTLTHPDFPGLAIATAEVWA